MNLNRVAVLLVALLSAACANANNELLFAGFAFSGNYENRQKLYPHSANLIDEKFDGAPLFDKVLREKLLARPGAAARVTLGLSDGRQGSKTSVAFALVRENVEFQKVDGKVWVLLSMQANILAFNWESKSLVASYPVRVRYTSVMASVPSETELRNLIRELYVGNSLGVNLFDIWLDRFEKVAIKDGTTKHMGVTSIVVSPEAGVVIERSGESVGAIKNQVANFVETSISNECGISMVPNSGGEAIGAKMAYRFANGEIFNLELPKPDYTVVFTLRDFVSKTIENTGSYQDIYRVKAVIRISQPDLNKSYLDENIYNTLYVARPKDGQVELNAWDQYYKTLTELIASTAKQMVRVDDDWLKNNASRAEAVRPVFMSRKNCFMNSNEE